MRGSEDVLAEREQGQFPISIGTSLALEGAGGIYPEEEPVNPPPLMKYNQLWINTATLFRNLFNSLSAADQERVTAEDLTIALASEFSPIDAAVAELVGRKVQVVFYRNALSRMTHWFPKANHKLPTTPKQRIYATLMQQALDALPTYLEEVDYRGFDGPIDGSGRSLMLTHSAVDLLSSGRFDSLTLLESHTGKLKERSQWGSKLGIRDATMPFNSFTLQVFGDGSTHFSAMPIKHRRAIQEIAKRDRWTAVTTMAKIRVGVTAIKDPAVRETLMAVLTNTSFPT